MLLLLLMALLAELDAADVSFFFYLLQPPGGCKGMCLLDCNHLTINRSRSPDLLRIGAPPPPRPESELLANPGAHGVVVKMEAV